MWNMEQFRKELAEIVNLDSSSENLQDIAVIGRMLANRLRDEGYLVETFDEDTRIEARTHSEKVCRSHGHSISERNCSRKTVQRRR